jgi:hypothetical protein
MHLLEPETTGQSESGMKQTAPAIHLRGQTADREAQKGSGNRLGWSFSR